MWHPLAGRAGGAIGCDLAGGYLRLARCVGGPRPGTAGLPAFETDIRVLSTPPSEKWTPPGPSAASILRDALRCGPVRGRHVVACLPSDAVTFRTLRLAPMGDADLRNAVAWKLAAEMGVAADQIVAQVVTSGRVTEAGKPRLEVVAVAARMEDVAALLDVLTKAGARARAIDVSVCAAARCVAALPGQNGDGMVLELGRTSATLALVANGSLTFLRSVGGGLGAYHRARSQRLGAGQGLGDPAAASSQGAPSPKGDATAAAPDPARAAAERAASAEAGKLFARELAREMSLALNYYEETLGGTAPAQALLVSAEELPDEAYAALALQTGVKFEPLRWKPPGASVATGPSDDHANRPQAEPPGAWATALGLALYDHEPSADIPGVPGVPSAAGAPDAAQAGPQEVAA